MAGLGLRFKNTGVKIPKPLIKVDGKTLIEHAVSSLDIPGNYYFVTRQYKNNEYNNEILQILNKLNIQYTEIRLNHNQNGAADAALYAEKYINNDEELIITNCDQLLKWNSQQFLNLISIEAAGCVVLYDSNSPKDSYAKIKNGKVIQIVEKNPISRDALVGVHYWKHGKHFVKSAKQLLIDNSLSNKESYISETYQYLIDDGYFIDYYKISNNLYVCLGTPEHIEEYLKEKNNANV
jgi:NDP-sugar pyrophosphorylase family protein